MSGYFNESNDSAASVKLDGGACGCTYLVMSTCAQLKSSCQKAFCMIRTARPLMSCVITSCVRDGYLPSALCF